jgi:hypothetical protein|tara:strand:+ start:6637 stop:6831 length:195 start_codon:yes stop_codon:yes gene_type:complete
MQEEDLKNAKQLLSQIIDIAKAQDLEWKKANMDKKGDQCVGDSWLVYHLIQLEKLLNKEENAKD